MRESGENGISGAIQTPLCAAETDWKTDFCADLGCQESLGRHWHS